MGRKPIPLNPDGTRNCKGCGLPFPLTEEYWPKHSGAAYGYESRCLACNSTLRSAQNSVYYAANRDKICAKQAAYVAANRDKIRARQAVYDPAYRAAVRWKALVAYSDDPPSCVCCGETTLNFLAIDHINGGGNKHRKEVGGGNSFYLWLRRNNYPPGFRTLCHNCNTAHGHYGYCPHTHYTPHLSPTDLAALVARAEELERAAR